MARRLIIYFLFFYPYTAFLDIRDNKCYSAVTTKLGFYWADTQTYLNLAIQTDKFALFCGALAYISIKSTLISRALISQSI